jgi:hypothetical protein
VSASKKSTGQYSAAHAALGGRTLKTGQSRCFVGYKKHTLRLWLHHYLGHPRTIVPAMKSRAIHFRPDGLETAVPESEMRF